MGTLVIEGVDDRLMSELVRMATLNHRSVEEQVKSLLRQSAPVPDRSKRAETASRIAAMTPGNVSQPDTVTLLREDRDR